MIIERSKIGTECSRSFRDCIAAARIPSDLSRSLQTTGVNRWTGAWQSSIMFFQGRRRANAPQQRQRPRLRLWHLNADRTCSHHYADARSFRLSTTGVLRPASLRRCPPAGSCRFSPTKDYFNQPDRELTTFQKTEKERPLNPISPRKYRSCARRLSRRKLRLAYLDRKSRLGN
jgi:hypothetical protein